jgi:hypothetical protein
VHLGEFICVSWVLDGLSSGVGVRVRCLLEVQCEERGVYLQYNIWGASCLVKTTPRVRCLLEVQCEERGVYLQYNIWG